MPLAVRSLSTALLYVAFPFYPANFSDCFASREIDHKPQTSKREKRTVIGESRRREGTSFSHFFCLTKILLEQSHTLKFLLLLLHWWLLKAMTQLSKEGRKNAVKEANKSNLKFSSSLLGTQFSHTTLFPFLPHSKNPARETSSSSLFTSRALKLVFENCLFPRSFLPLANFVFLLHTSL